MSIDLYVRQLKPVSLALLADEARLVLSDLLGGCPVPELKSGILATGQSSFVVGDTICGEDSPVINLSIAGEPENVSLVATETNLNVVIGAQRTCLEFALGAAVSIAAARALGEAVCADSGFFGFTDCIAPDAFAGILRRSASADDFREASETLWDRFPSLL